MADKSSSPDPGGSQPRRRGRPRKHPLPASSGSETPAKRPRGRPRKHPLPAPDAPKRRRGRPPKIARDSAASRAGTRRTPPPTPTPAKRPAADEAQFFRLIELKAALDSELIVFSQAFPNFLERLRTRIEGQLNELRERLRSRLSLIKSPDDLPHKSLLNLIQKTAARFASFRSDHPQNLDDLARLSRRLEKTLRRLRRLDGD